MKEYKVRGGDTLSAIAQRELGNAVRWPEIYGANKSQMDDAFARARPALERTKRSGHHIKHPADLLTAGQVLRIP